VAVRRHGLQDLQKHRGAEHDAENKDRASWIGEAEESTERSKRDDVLKMSKGSHRRAHQERRELEIDAIDEVDMRQRGIGDRDDR